ncbi:hypothetical protein [Marinimicrobium sp. ABcell2]|uniref:hypothetical protein n=1 Tax=Marinimicrobium sp. ABcell2 TaxID=3069751 RepID=UPI0027B1B05C|nr:hypothetical protein [Marinimicrobium sp. ABcell2]MDQ2077433.1 hypothetical protein [Marinimicrobium sp. ABcell2]
MISSSTLAFMITGAVLAGGISVFSLVVGASHVKAMLSNAQPGEQVIQLSISRRFLSLAIALWWALVFGFVCMFAAQRAVEQSFLAASDADRAGMMGSSFLLRLVAADDRGGCSHVSRLDNKPLTIHIDSALEPSVLCGLSHQSANIDRMSAFVKVGEEYRVLAGRWPFHYTLSVDPIDDVLGAVQEPE